MQLPKSKYLRALVGSIIISAIVGGFEAFASWYSILPNGSDKLLTEVSTKLVGILAITIVLNLLYLIVNTFRWLFKIGGVQGSDVGVLAIFCVTCTVLTCVLIIVGELIRRSAFTAMVARARPLVVAIKQYQTNNGIPPVKLDNLVPDFIAKIPETGVAAYPEYSYITNAMPSKYAGNKWVLSVDVSTGDLTRDELIYYPDHNYPPNEPGIHVGRIGAWARIRTDKHSQTTSGSD